MNAAVRSTQGVYKSHINKGRTFGQQGTGTVSKRFRCNKSPVQVQSAKRPEEGKPKTY